ncbi:protein kinase [bacterium]|nr:protein kinase [candidate division CSSED10-310 bacterium]
MSSPPRRCPNCHQGIPLARRRCPYCRTLLPVGEETRSLEVVFLQDKLSGRFEIISELRSRGIGKVFLAHDLILEHQIIIKSLHLGDISGQAFFPKWEQNARRAIRLDHPNVARNYICGRAGPLFYFISEYIGDRMLSEYLEGSRPLPIWKCLRIGRDLARGIHAGYKMGIAHHRLKPANIAVSMDGFTRILDYGSAQGTLDALSSKPWSAAAESSAYFAPEQIETGLSDHLSDQYRIGLIMYQMLTGHHPFPGMGEGGAFLRLGTNPAPVRNLNSSLPVQLELIVNQTLAADPNMRYENGQELAAALESLEPELWTPVAEPLESGEDPEKVTSDLIARARRALANRELHPAVFLCEQALVHAPYNQQVTDLLVDLRGKLDRENEVRSLINNGLSAFYEQRLDTALSVLTRARQIDKDNPEITRLTHEVLQEQERIRLTQVLLQATRIDLSQNALAQAMAKIVRIQDIDPGNQAALELKAEIESAMEDKATLGIMLSRTEESLRTGELEVAENYISKILRIDPSNSEALILAARISEEQRRNTINRLKNKLESVLRNGSSEEVIRILAQIADMDPALADELHDKIERIKTVIAGSVKQQPPADPHPTEPTQPAIPAAPPEPGIEQPEPEPDTGLQISFQPEKKPINWVAWLAGLGAILIMFVLIRFTIGPTSGNKTQDQAGIPSKVTIATAPTQTPAVRPIPTSSPIPRPSATPLPPLPTTPSRAEQLDWLLNQADNLEKQGKYHEAAALFEKVLDIEKTNIHAQGRIARIQRILNGESTNMDSTERTIPLNISKKEPAPAYPPPSPTQPAWRDPPSPVSETADTGPIDKTPRDLGFSVENVSFSPSPPRQNQKLRVTIRILEKRKKQILGLWFNFRMKGETGYSQLTGKRFLNTYKFEISENDVTGDIFYYFVSVMDKSGNELLHGSPEHPKWVPISNPALNP